MNSYNDNFDTFADLDAMGLTQPETVDDVADRVAEGAAKGLKALEDQQKDNGDAPARRAKVSTKVELEKEKSLKEGAKYFYGFSSNLLKLDLTPTEFKIIVHILETLKWGNVVAMTQKSISTKTGISTSVVNRNWKSLLEKNVLIADEEGSIYLNTNFFFIGLYANMDAQRRRDFEKASGYNKEITHMHNSPGTDLTVKSL